MQMPIDQPTGESAAPEQQIPIDYCSLDGWSDDDHGAAFDAFCRSASKIAQGRYQIRGDIIDADSLIKTAQAALAEGRLPRAEARRFFEDNFRPVAFDLNERFDGFLTGYFEPELPASRLPSADFPIPLLSPPKDLAEATSANQVYRHDRAAIQSGALNGQGLELVWLNNKTDAYFVHVQGSARLRLEDGQTMRVSFAGKTGHAYTSLGKVLYDHLGIARNEMTADVLADWMRQNTNELDAFTAQNRSFIFFRELEGVGDDAGPIGAADIPLCPGRSLAIDHSLHTYGLPIWLSTPKPVLDDNAGQLGRLMIAHDTGSAITGSQRGDIFVGSGAKAGHIAGRIQSPARMVLLVPKS